MGNARKCQEDVTTRRHQTMERESREFFRCLVDKNKELKSDIEMQSDLLKQIMNAEMAENDMAIMLTQQVRQIAGFQKRNIQGSEACRAQAETAMIDERQG